MNAKLIPLAMLAATSSFAGAADNLDSNFRKNGDAITANFEEQRAILQRSSAVMRDGRKDIAYGTVVSADGFILTKASEVQSITGLSVLIDTTKYEGHIVATDPVWDVALVKIEVQGLFPVDYATYGEVPQGTWVVANGATSNAKRRALGGIISARPREIPAEGGTALGVMLKNGSKGLEIEQITPNSGAEKAGLQKGDALVTIDGKKIAKLDDISAAMKDKKAGTFLKIVFRRGGTEQSADVRLMARAEIIQQKSRNDEMSGEYSLRRTGFPRVIQHDILGRKDSVGGPLLDLDGRCVGMTIARADRAQSFAIPAGELKSLADKLMKEAMANGS